MALAEATVRVTLEVARFERELRQKTAQAAQRAARDFDREMNASLAATGKSASTNFRDAVRVGMARAGREASKDFDVNFRNGLTQTGGRAAQRLAQGLRTSVSRAGIDAGRGFADNVTNVLTAAGTATGQAFVTAIGTNIISGATRAGTAAGSAIQASTGRAAATAGRNAGKSFSLNFGLGSAGVSAPLIAAIAVAGSALVEGLRPALPIVAAFPALLGTITATALITATAFRGIGDAIKAVGSNDIDKINESMAKLSPLAQGFVREFAQARPVLASLRADIQDAFFGQLSGQVTKLAAAFTGPLRTGITDVARSTGALGNAFLAAFSEAQGVANLEKLFRGTSAFLDNLRPGLTDLTRGFLDFIGATSPGLRSLGDALGNLLTRMGNFLSRSAQSGDALRWVEGGITGLRTLTSALADAGRAFGVILEAAQPLSFFLSGVFGLVVNLVNAFGNLPGPIQTAALAALLFARSGMPEFIRNTTNQTGPLATALNQMSTAYTTAATRVQQLAVVSTATAAATTAVGRGVDAATDGATRFAQTVGRTLVGAVGAVDTAATQAATALRTGFVRAGLEAANAVTATSVAVNRASTALQTGFVRAGLEAANAGTAIRTGLARAAIEAEAALNTVTSAGREVQATLREGLVPSALLVGQTVERAGAAVSRFGASLRDQVVPGATTARTAVATLGTSIQTGFIRATLEAQSAATRFGAAIQTGVISAAIAGNSALTNFGNTLRSGVLRPLVEAQAAYQTTSASIRNFAASQTALNGPLAQAPGLVSRLGTAFTNLSASVAGAGAGLRAGIAGPVSAIGSSLNGLAATAAGAGRALASGLGSAVNGIVGALGGPWGLAIAAAGVALSVFASSQDKARQAAAAHQAQISTLADTLDKQTGAITAATRAAAAQQFAQNDAGASARRLGIDLGTVVDATLGSNKAQTTLSTTLRNSARGAIDAAGGMKTLELQSKNLNVPVDTLIDAFLGNAAAIGQVGKAAENGSANLETILSVGRALIPDQAALGQAVGSTASGLSEQAARAREVAAAMTPAQAAAQRFADILGILADKTASADQKARALEEALHLLAGGTIDAEVAQGRFTDLLKQLDDGLKSGTEGLQGYGSELVNSTGRINANTTAGSFLLNTYSQLSSGLAATSAATIKAGQANNDMEGALRSVAEQTQQARDQFIQTATALGLNETEANALADAYGLIPKNVATLVGTNGTAAITLQEVGNVQAALKILPPNTPVTVTSITEEAMRKLNDLGYTIKTLPNGKFEVYANTAPAQSGVDQFIRDNSGRVIAVRVETVYGAGVQAVDASGRRIGNPAVAAGAIFENYARGGLRPIRGNIAQVVHPNTWRVIGDRAKDDEAYIPINRSSRSREILDQTARRMGYELFASGGIAGRSTNRQMAGNTLTVAPGAIVVNAPYSDPALVARAAINELARTAVS